MINTSGFSTVQMLIFVNVSILTKKSLINSNENVQLKCKHENLVLVNMHLL